jgi:hypothetical protein
LNKDDGKLNDCILCDELNSGPIFKRFAGRNRRNSGIIAEIGREKGEIYKVDHNYLDFSPNHRNQK